MKKVIMHGGANMNELITLVDEGGNEHQFEIEAILEVEDERYAVLIPMSEEYANSNEAIIMKFGQDEESGEEVLFDIESDEEWNRVADAYDEIIEEDEEEPFEDD